MIIKSPDKLRIKAQTGFSLVDVMVGMVIALLGVIIMFQVFAVSEGIKRTTTSGGDALQNGASALFSLERSLRQAGYGIFSSTNAPPIPSDGAGIAPVLITPGTPNTSDTLVLTYRQNWEYGSFPPDPTAFASAVPPALTLETVTVNAYNAANLVDLVNGRVKMLSTTAPQALPPYATQLPPAAPTANVISDGIVLLKAEYGTDVLGLTPPVLVWSQAPPVNPRSVKAVRVVVVARSEQPEKPNPATGLCNATTVFPTWTDSAALPLNLTANLGLTGAVNDNWTCYRYKTFEDTVPLRND